MSYLLRIEGIPLFRLASLKRNTQNEHSNIHLKIEFAKHIQMNHLKKYFKSVQKKIFFKAEFVKYY